LLISVDRATVLTTRAGTAYAITQSESPLRGVERGLCRIATCAYSLQGYQVKWLRY